MLNYYIKYSNANYILHNRYIFNCYNNLQNIVSHNILKNVIYYLGDLMTIPNRQGRAFEYIVCKELSSLNKHLIFTKNAEKDQERDRKHFINCAENIKKSYKISSVIISKWVAERFNLQKASNVFLDRFTDQKGIEGDVTDVQLNIDGNIINLSIKHQHEALKHPRLSRVPNWINVTDIRIKNEYKEKLNSIWDNIILFAEEIKKGAITFKELDDVDKDFRFKKIYSPLCNHVMNFLINNITNSKQVKNLFFFMVGSSEFFKIIDYKDSIKILDFSGIVSPTKVAISHPQDHYLYMDFNNRWLLSFRLHTASSRIKERSIKFDVKAEKMEVNEIIELKKGIS